MNGLTIGDAIVLGRADLNSGMADLSDVDLTAARIDRRVKFQCASHRAYYAADGTIQFAEPDVWPLEYVNGVAVGRHEPEPQATNLKIGSRAPTSALYMLTKTTNAVLSPAGIDEYIEYKTASVTATPTLFSDVRLSESRPLTVSVIGRNGTAEMLLRKENGTTTTAFSGEFSRAVLLSDYDATASRNRYSVFFPRTLGATGYIWHMQLETGVIATSPIITTDAAVTRAAAFVSVTNPGMAASGIQVWYSDGAVDEYDFAGESNITLPFSRQNWGTRYIERITYSKNKIDPLRDIDLTVDSLDNRVKFSCASRHTVVAADETLQLADVNTWPLEYRNGQPAGRHEPEPQATNYAPYARDFTRWIRASSTVIANAGTGVTGNNTAHRIAAAGASYPRIVSRVVLTGTAQTISVVVRAGTVSYLHGTIENAAHTQTLRFFADMSALQARTTTAVGTISGAASIRELASGWLLLVVTVTAPDASSSYDVFFGPSGSYGATSATAGDSILADWFQIEAGSNPTSLIETNGAAATRAAAFATVKNLGGQATAIRVHYSDGTTTDIEFAADGSDIQLPQSTTNWGARYITRIQYARGF